jgi:hypothetical protein
VVAKLRKGLLVNKQAIQRIDMQRFDPMELNNAEIKKQYQFKTLNRFAALEYLDDNVDINRAWENVRENIKISA